MIVRIQLCCYAAAVALPYVEGLANGHGNDLTPLAAAAWSFITVMHLVQLAAYWGQHRKAAT